MKKISLVYMLAGLSSRFGGKAKAFAKVGPEGETLLEYSLGQALENDFDKVVFIVSRKTEKQFRDYFGDSYMGVPIVYALQEFDESVRERPWGTNDALCSAKDLIDGPFVVCNGDDIYGASAFSVLFNHLNDSGEDVTLGYKLGKVLSDKGSVNRGIFSERDGFVETVVENLGIDRGNMGERKLNDDDLCSMNIFGLRKETLDMLYDKLVKFKEEHSGDSKVECYLPAELNNLISEGKIKMKLNETDELWLGLTNPEDEEVVREKLKEI